MPILACTPLSTSRTLPVELDTKKGIVTLMAGKKKAKAPSGKKASRAANSARAAAKASGGKGVGGESIVLSAPTRTALEAVVAAAPVIPGKAMRAESRTLLKAIERDSDELSRRGLRAQHVSIITEAAAKLESLEHAILAMRSEGRTAAEIHAEKEAMALRTRALEDLEFALLSKPDSDEGKAAAERIARIRENDGIDDLIDDLRVVIPFFSESKKKLEAVGVDVAGTIKQAKSLADTLDNLVSARRLSSGEKSLYSERDAVATLLWDTMNEVRRIGRYAFRDRPKSARDYGSTYNRQRRAVAKAKKTRESKKTPVGPSPEE